MPLSLHVTFDISNKIILSRMNPLKKNNQFSNSGTEQQFNVSKVAVFRNFGWHLFRRGYHDISGVSMS